MCCPLQITPIKLSPSTRKKIVWYSYEAMLINFRIIIDIYIKLVKIEILVKMINILKTLVGRITYMVVALYKYNHNNSIFNKITMSSGDGKQVFLVKEYGRVLFYKINE